MKYLLFVLIFICGCSTFEYDNPLDKESSSFREELLEDDDNDGVLNYEEDENEDGVKNFRDTSSKYNENYFLDNEDEIVGSKDNIIKPNDGSLKIAS